MFLFTVLSNNNSNFIQTFGKKKIIVIIINKKYK